MSKSKEKKEPAEISIPYDFGDVTPEQGEKALRVAMAFLHKLGKIDFAKDLVLIGEYLLQESRKDS